MSLGPTSCDLGARGGRKAKLSESASESLFGFWMQIWTSGSSTLVPTLSTLLKTHASTRTHLLSLVVRDRAWSLITAQ